MRPIFSLAAVFLLPICVYGQSLTTTVYITITNPAIYATKTITLASPSIATSSVGCSQACSNFINLNTTASIDWCNCGSFLVQNTIATCILCNIASNITLASFLGSVSSACSELGFTPMSVYPTNLSSTSNCTLQPNVTSIFTSSATSSTSRSLGPSVRVPGATNTSIGMRNTTLSYGFSSFAVWILVLWIFQFIA
jgi:hypothetical protein